MTMTKNAAPTTAFRQAIEDKLRARISSLPRDWKSVAVTALCPQGVNRTKVSDEQYAEEIRTLNLVGKATKAPGFDFRVEEHVFDTRGESKKGQNLDADRSRPYGALVVYRK